MAVAAAKTPAATTPVAAKPAEPRRRDVVPRFMRISHFKGSEFARARYDAVIQADDDFSDALRPGFWAHVAQGLRGSMAQADRTGAFIDLGTVDHAFYALLYVRAVTKEGLEVQCIGPAIDPKSGRTCPVDLSTGLPWTGRLYDIAWNPEAKGFEVVRKADGEVVAGGSEFTTREHALEWITKAGRTPQVKAA